MPNDGKLLTLQEVARRLDCSYALVYKWVRQGRIKAIDPPERGYRVREEDCIRPLALVGILNHKEREKDYA